MNALQSAWAWLTQSQQWQGPDGIPDRLIQHLEYTGVALLVAALIALPLGLLIGHTGRGSFVAVTLAFVWMLLVRLRIETLEQELEGAELDEALAERWAEGGDALVPAASGPAGTADR